MVGLQARAGDSSRPQDQSIEKAVASLNHALKILDENDLPAHIGARLQEVIELVLSASCSTEAESAGGRIDPT